MGTIPKKTVHKASDLKRSNIVGTKKLTEKIDIADLLKALSKPPREACQDCVRKHLGQAVVLLNEMLMGYPEHKWLAVGHLAEAAEECIGQFPEVAHMIREDRLLLMADSVPDLMKYLRDDFEILTMAQDSQ